MTINVQEKKSFILKKIKSPFMVNILWNFSGMILPMIMAFFMIPVLIHHIGLEKFSVFSLVIMLIGAMTLFDFGLTRSITNSVTRYFNEGNSELLLSSVKCGWLILSGIVLIMSLILFIMPGEITNVILKSQSPEIYSEVKNCILLTAFALPFVMAQATFSSVLEAFSSFKKINMFRTPFWVLMYATPMVFSFFTHNLFYITLSVVGLRVVMAFVFYFLMMGEIKKITKTSLLKAKTPKNIFIEIIKYGSWISIGNIIIPVMLYLDRFIVASTVGAKIYPYYGTPYEVVSRMSIITAAVCGVLFPMLVGRMQKDIVDANNYYKRSIIVILFLTAPLAFFGVLLSKWFLSHWINPDFSEHSWVIFCLFLVGFMIYGLFQPAFVWIMASGKPWITTLIQIADLILYLIYLPWMAHHYGITGAAIGWDLRMLVGLILLFFIRRRLYLNVKSKFYKF